jgi:hypothetical protein
MAKITTPRRLTAPRNQTNHDGRRQKEIPSAHNSHASHGFQTAAPASFDDSIARKATRGKDVRQTPTHGGMTDLQRAGMGRGGLGHGTVDAGGLPVNGGVHPFDKPPSDGFKTGKLAPVKSGMRNRSNDSAHGGATLASGGHTGDPMDILATADPRHPNFRGKNCGD